MFANFIKYTNYLTNKKISKEWTKTSREVDLLKKKFDLNLYQKIISENGISEGDIVYFQISLNKTGISFALIPKLISATLEVIGKNGTMICPTFTYQSSLLGHFITKHQYISEKTPTTTGVFNEIFRRTEGCIRSDHPIYSYAGIGSSAADLLNNHTQSIYLYDKHNPISILNQLENTKCLSFNIPFRSYHPIHHITSNIVDINKFYLPYAINTNYQNKGKLIERKIILPNEFYAFLIDIAIIKSQLTSKVNELNIPGLPGYLYQMKSLSNQIESLNKSLLKSILSQRKIPLVNFLGKTFYLKKYFYIENNTLKPKNAF